MRIMRIESPGLISSRLLPSIVVGGATIGIEYNGSSPDGRTVYRWTIDLPDGSEHSGTDLRSGVGGGSLQDGLESLLSFLAACGESVSYRERTGRGGDNADMFPPAVGQWAAGCADDLALAESEITESPIFHE